jgi:hypothetical protein
VDILAGGSGSALVTVADLQGGSATQVADISVPALELQPGTLYAIPLANTATTADVVRIAIATGATTEPFYYLMCANMTMPDWVTYAEDTFNTGALGGAADEPDGIWDPAGIDADTILLGPDSFFRGQEKADLGLAGRHRLELTVNPMGGHEVTDAAGLLCNFGVRFAQAGTASFGFTPATSSIDRTYYRDAANVKHYWGALLAGPDGVLNVTGVDNTVVVTE